jgi:uncharacterized protein (TIGR02145 family)
MSQNLNVRKFRNGESIPEIRSYLGWINASEKQIPAFCFFNNIPSLGRTYGKLYNWYAIMDPRGLAPAGWRIPEANDWDILTETSGGKLKAGIALKSRREWDWDGTGTNETGFNALPGGYRRADDGSFTGIEDDGLWWMDDGFWWTSTPYDYALIWGRNLSCNSGQMFKFSFRKGDGLSVRCIRDESK